MRSEAWLASLEREVEEFAARHSFTYSKSRRHISGSFEVGCFLALAAYYERNGSVHPDNLQDATFRYLTTPQGRPKNFSYLRLRLDEGEFIMRQQIRIASHVGPDVFFTPDIVVLPADAEIEEVKDQHYANGRQWFSYVSADVVVAAHECKSLVPFPELFVSFIGMFICAHGWFGKPRGSVWRLGEGSHLAPTLFVGGSPSYLHERMAKGLRDAYPINIVLGLHRGTWNLRGRLSTLVVPGEVL